MQSLKRCTLSWPIWLFPSVASGSSLPANSRHVFSNDDPCAAREGVANAMRESTSTIVFISLSKFSALAGARCGQLSPQFRTADVRAMAPILKEVPPEPLTITDIAVRVRKPGFVSVEEWLL